mmetsp:Transcript_8377/g.14456  ORF Transcript_8377/g.14456 Transcript_8377/m.14456 type:complete len:124 (-) Transcript_8377:490-861(-)
MGCTASELQQPTAVKKPMPKENGLKGILKKPKTEQKPSLRTQLSTESTSTCSTMSSEQQKTLQVTFEESHDFPVAEGDPRNPVWFFSKRVDANPKILETMVDQKRIRDFGIGCDECEYTEYTV